MDLKSTFLNGYINDEVYVEQPKGFFEHILANNVYMLHKALYALKQAPRARSERLTKYLNCNGYSRGNIHKTLFHQEIQL